MASLFINFDGESLYQLTPRLSDDLPLHVKGNAQWEQPSRTRPPCYYVHPEGRPPQAVEFINNHWYGVSVIQGQFAVRQSHTITDPASLGLGWWSTSDPAHPEYQQPRALSRSTFRFTQTSDSSSSGSSTASAHTAQGETQPYQPINVDTPLSPIVSDPEPSIDAITAGLETTASLQGTLPLDPPNMSVNASTVAPTGNPSSGGMTGIAPAIFDGKRSNAENFLKAFRRYKMMNENNNVMSVPFLRILTALSYIRGTLVKDWVNAQDEWLEKRVDPTKTGHLARSDEALWDEFVANFRTAWKDTAKTQNAYDQLMKLTMDGWNIDTYNVTFNRLAAAAGWESDAQGTIARYRSGLRNVVHRKILERENWPVDMVGWQEAAQKEVKRAREIENQGLNNFRRNQQSRDSGPFQTGQRQNNTTRSNSNSGIVPMEVDGVTIPFQKLTDEERIQYRKEGRCFRCRQQGHMASRCPKNANRPTNLNARTTTTTSTNTTTTDTNTTNAPTPNVPIVATTTTTPTPTTTTTPKLTRAQRIRAIEEEMDEEERGTYLDARDMGEDFCAAGL